MQIKTMKLKLRDHSFTVPKKQLTLFSHRSKKTLKLQTFEEFGYANHDYQAGRVKRNAEHRMHDVCQL